MLNALASFSIILGIINFELQVKKVTKKLSTTANQLMV